MQGVWLQTVLPTPSLSLPLCPALSWLVPKKELVGGPADSCGDLIPQGPFALSHSCILSSQATGWEHLPLPDAQLGSAAGAAR